MAEVNVVKQPKPATPDLNRWLGFDTPLFRGSIFGVNPFALMRQFTEDMDRVFQPSTSDSGRGVESGDRGEGKGR